MILLWPLIFVFSNLDSLCVNVWTADAEYWCTFGEPIQGIRDKSI